MNFFYFSSSKSSLWTFFNLGARKFHFSKYKSLIFLNYFTYKYELVKYLTCEAFSDALSDDLQDWILFFNINKY